jgi:hypothetical protein
VKSKKNQLSAKFSHEKLMLKDYFHIPDKKISYRYKKNLFPQNCVCGTPVNTHAKMFVLDCT